MDENSSKIVAAVLLVDGLTSEARPSGEVVLNQVTNWQGVHRNWARYEPYSRDGKVVETTNVFPALLGLPPSENPGRAGLERLLDRDLHQHCNHFASIHTYANVTEIERLSTSSRVHSRVSKYSAAGHTLLICAPSKELINRFLGNALRFDDVKIAHQCSPVSGWRDALGRNHLLASQFQLIGWCHGALLAGLVESGVRFEGVKKTEVSPDRTRKYRLDELSAALPRVSSNGLRPLVYVKDPAWEARNGIDKTRSIEFVGRILHLLMQYAENDAVLVVSDHNSEPGRDETLVGPTATGLFSRSAELVDKWTRETQGIMLQEEMFSYLRAAWL